MNPTQLSFGKNIFEVYFFSFSSAKVQPDITEEVGFVTRSPPRGVDQDVFASISSMFLINFMIQIF